MRTMALTATSAASYSEARSGVELFAAQQFTASGDSVHVKFTNGSGSFAPSRKRHSVFVARLSSQFRSDSAAGTVYAALASTMKRREVQCTVAPF